VADQANLKRIRQAPRRLRRPATRQARRLLDEAYQAYLQELASSRNSRNNQSDPYSDSLIHSHPTPEPIEPIPQSVDSSILELPPSPISLLQNPILLTLPWR